jgi:hypothetical protein
MDASRYQLVDSLYGPGTVAAWLLSLCALLISWTLNTSSRRKDTISVDLIAALLLPLIAAGHVIFQIVRLPVSVAEVVTTENAELQKYASALEAPLNICETFSLAALLFAIPCGPFWGSLKWRRLGLVLLVGLLSWAAENVMFAMATMRGVRLMNATLSRPYLFFLTPIVAGTWGFLALCLAVGAFSWVVGQVNTRRDREDGKASRAGPSRQETCLPTETEAGNPAVIEKIGREDLETMLRQFNELEEKQRQFDELERDHIHWEPEFQARAERSSRLLTTVTMFFLPLSFVYSIFSLSIFETKDPSGTYYKHFILIPKSSGSLSDLDQILALVGGAISVLASIRRAYRSRFDDKQPLQSSTKRRRSI